MLSLILIAVGIAILFFSWWTSKQAISERSGAEKVEEPEKNQIVQKKTYYGPVTIYYATQTGTAGRFARQLVQEGKLQNVVCEAKCIDECKIDDLQNNDSVAVFLISTHYEGEATDDMVSHWKTMSKMKDPSIFSKLKFTGFSLGDQNYKFFNQMGRLFNKKLLSLGATELAPFGEGSNHAGQIEEHFEEWSIPLWNILHSHLSVLDEEAAFSIWESSDPNAFTIMFDAPESESLIQSLTETKYQPETEVHSNHSRNISNHSKVR